MLYTYVHLSCFPRVGGQSPPLSSSTPPAIPPPVGEIKGSLASENPGSFAFGEAGGWFLVFEEIRCSGDDGTPMPSLLLTVTTLSRPNPANGARKSNEKDDASSNKGGLSSPPLHGLKGKDQRLPTVFNSVSALFPPPPGAGVICSF